MHRAALTALSVLMVAPLALGFAPLPPTADGPGDGVRDLTGVVEDAAPELACAGVQVLLPELELCTHGPDAPPAAAARSTGAGAPVPRREVTCVGDGRSGQRVEVLYLHGPGAAAADSTRRAQVTRWAEQAEWTVHESARRLGGDRRIRWRTDSCVLRVVSQQVSSAALGDFATMVKELRNRGFSRTDRSYLLFVDAKTYCGIATAPRDDRATSNRADATTGYARVDRPCWTAGDAGYHSIAAHELLHTFGAVQASAPHGTRGAHCSDEHDLLCYDDGSGARMRTVCRDGNGDTTGAGDANDRLLDCRGDDYFHPSPPKGSYLATHWNTARSARLHDPRATQSSGTTGSGSGGSTTKPPSPTGDPVGYALWLLTQ